MSPLLLALAKKKEVDVSAHLEIATDYLWLAFALIVLFFVLRPELWRRVWFQRIDPRGPALARMTMGITVLWTFLDLMVLQGEWLFTDQGLLLTELARKNYGGKLRTLWDPEHGFEHWYDIFEVLTNRWTILHIRSDPPFVHSMFAALFVFATLMTVGLWTRVSTVMTWVLVLQLYNYTPIYYTGGDTVMRVMMFLAMFVDWGQAYSLDAWRKRRKAILRGAKQVPAYKRIPAWPVRLLMLQLAIIYCATGVLKSGPTWAHGSALYYALNLDHFYRWPAHLLYAYAHKYYVTRFLTVFVHWWEVLFPLVLVGEALRGYDRDKAAGVWQGPVLRWTLYSLAVLASIFLVWSSPTWLKTVPLFVLAAIIYFERVWMPPPPRTDKGVAAWAIRLLSWMCLVGFLLLGAYFADLGVYYYYKVPKRVAAAWMRDKELLQSLASAATLAIPLVAATIVIALRTWLPRAYRVLRDWLLGKRLWLVIGFGMHLGIDLTMNVGTFVQVMIAIYPVWLGGRDVEAFWRFMLWRAAKPGEGERPPLPDKGLRRVARRLGAPFERAKYRIRRPPWTVVHGSSEAAIRRAALLRCWDLGERLEFELDPDHGETLSLRDPERKSKLAGGQAGRELISLFPGLWWLWPISMFPGVGRLATMILRQRV